MRVARFISGSVLLLALTSGIEAGQPKAPPAPKPAKPVPVRPNKAANQGAKQAARQAVRQPPAEELRRFLNMSPEEREKNISKLTPAQQQRMRNQLDRLDRLPPEQRERRLSELGKLEKLSPERRQAVTQQMQSIQNNIPAGPLRRAYLHSPEFYRDFTPDEQDIIRERFPGAAK